MPSKPRLFPKEILAFSAEDHFHSVFPKGSWMYRSILLFLLLALGSLPMIRVDVTCSSRGILQVRGGTNPVLSAVGSQVVFSRLEENRRMEKGDTLMVLNHDELLAELADLKARKKTLQQYTGDLNHLIRQSGEITTERYRQERITFKHFESRMYTELNYQQEEFEVHRDLFLEGVIPRLEYEEIRSRYESVKASYAVEQQGYYQRWQEQLHRYHESLYALHAREEQLQEELDRHYITAPASGYLVDCRQLLPGTQLVANQVIARIVPDHELIADCILLPDKIAYIRPGKLVKLRLDAYPAGTNGYLEGIVTDVPEDAVIESGTPIYRVKCRIPQHIYHQDTGRREPLRSGMTFTAHFVLNRKSILELIVEKTERWLYPADYSRT